MLENESKIQAMEKSPAGMSNLAVLGREEFLRLFGNGSGCGVRGDEQRGAPRIEILGKALAEVRLENTVCPANRSA